MMNTLSDCLRFAATQSRTDYRTSFCAMAPIVRDRSREHRKISLNLVFRICVCLRVFAHVCAVFARVLRAFLVVEFLKFDPDHLKRSTSPTEPEE